MTAKMSTATGSTRPNPTAAKSGNGQSHKEQEEERRYQLRLLMERKEREKQQREEEQRRLKQQRREIRRQEQAERMISEMALQDYGFLSVRCDACHKHITEIEQYRLMQCSRCKKAYYCFGECFRRNMPSHVNSDACVKWEPIPPTPVREYPSPKYPQYDSDDDDTEYIVVNGIVQKKKQDEDDGKAERKGAKNDNEQEGDRKEEDEDKEDEGEDEEDTRWDAFYIPHHEIRDRLIRSSGIEIGNRKTGGGDGEDKKDDDDGDDDDARSVASGASSAADSEMSARCFGFRVRCATRAEQRRTADDDDDDREEEEGGGGGDDDDSAMCHGFGSSHKARTAVVDDDGDDDDDSAMCHGFGSSHKYHRKWDEMDDDDDADEFYGYNAYDDDGDEDASNYETCREDEGEDGRDVAPDRIQRFGFRYYRRRSTGDKATMTLLAEQQQLFGGRGGLRRSSFGSGSERRRQQQQQRSVGRLGEWSPSYSVYRSTWLDADKLVIPEYRFEKDVIPRCYDSPRRRSLLEQYGTNPFVQKEFIPVREQYQQRQRMQRRGSTGGIRVGSTTTTPWQYPPYSPIRNSAATMAATTNPTTPTTTSTPTRKRWVSCSNAPRLVPNTWHGTTRKTMPLSSSPSPQPTDRAEDPLLGVGTQSYGRPNGDKEGIEGRAYNNSQGHDGDDDDMTEEYETCREADPVMIGNLSLRSWHNRTRDNNNNAPSTNGRSTTTAATTTTTTTNTTNTQLKKNDWNFLTENKTNGIMGGGKYGYGASGTTDPSSSQNLSNNGSNHSLGKVQLSNGSSHSLGKVNPATATMAARYSKPPKSPMRQPLLSSPPTARRPVHAAGGASPAAVAALVPGDDHLFSGSRGSPSSTDRAAAKYSWDKPVWVLKSPLRSTDRGKVAKEFIKDVVSKSPKYHQAYNHGVPSCGGRQEEDHDFPTVPML